MIWLQLFWEFFKTGLFSIGGGLATLPFLREMSDHYGWFTQAELADMLAVSESTPGPIGVNMATYVGITATGGNILGGILATFALVLPSVIVILIVVRILDRFHENRYVQSSLKVIRPVSVGLVTAAVIAVLQTALLTGKNVPGSAWWMPVWPALGLFVVLGLARWKLQKMHPIVFILVGAAAGILLKL